MAQAKINSDGSITGTFDSLSDLYAFYMESMKAGFQPDVHVPMPPGYVVPMTTYVRVPNSRIGDGDRFSDYPNIESAIQIRLGELANTFSSQKMSDDEVRARLTETANDAIAVNGSFDPLVPQAPALVEKYVKIYRVAVTPV